MKEKKKYISTNGKTNMQMHFKHEKRLGGYKITVFVSK